MNTHARTHARTHTHAHADIHTHVKIHTKKRTRTYAHIHAGMRTRARAHTHTHTHTHIHRLMCSSQVYRLFWSPVNHLISPADKHTLFYCILERWLVIEVYDWSEWVGKLGACWVGDW